MTHKDNRKIRNMLDKDFKVFKAGRAYFKIHQEDSHRFFNEVNGEIIGDFNDMPDWAKKAINKHRNNNEPFEGIMLPSLPKKIKSRKKALK